MTAIIFSLRIAKPKIGLTSLRGCWLPPHPFFYSWAKACRTDSKCDPVSVFSAQLSPRLSFVAMARLPTATSDYYRLLPSPVEALSWRPEHARRRALFDQFVRSTSDRSAKVARIA